MTDSLLPPVAGLVLAAGAGARFGRPKALVRGAGDIAWVRRAVEVLVSAGVTRVYVVVGASADAVAREVPTGARVVVAENWSEGMGASLRAGLDAVRAGRSEVVGVVVMLVDTPGVGSDVVRRLVSHAHPDALVRAAYAGRPGHPVLLGRDHWAGVAESARGDRGARDYLRDHDVVLVECSDVGSGADVDTADGLRRWLAAERGRTDGSSPP